MRGSEKISERAQVRRAQKRRQITVLKRNELQRNAACKRPVT